MTKSEIFTAAWARAREIRVAHASIRAAFASALRSVYAKLKQVVFTAPVIDAEVRGGGVGLGAWIARITGTHEKFGLAREFLKKSGESLSRSRRSGSMSWTLDRPGLYELRGVQYHSGLASIGHLDNGFALVDDTGAVKRLTKAEAMAIYA